MGYVPVPWPASVLEYQLKSPGESWYLSEVLKPSPLSSHLLGSYQFPVLLGSEAHPQIQSYCSPAAGCLAAE